MPFRLRSTAGQKARERLSNSLHFEREKSVCAIAAGQTGRRSGARLRHAGPQLRGRAWMVRLAQATEAHVQLTDTQLVVLSAALNREDGSVLPLPANLKGGAIAKVCGALIAKGLAEEIALDREAARTAPEQVYRFDPGAEPVTLRITDLARQALNVEAPSAADAAEPASERIEAEALADQDHRLVRLAHRRAAVLDPGVGAARRLSGPRCSGSWRISRPGSWTWWSSTRSTACRAR